VCQSLASPNLYEDDLWCVRHAEPAGVPGWMMLIARRHVAGPAHFDDREAAVFGVALRHFERVLEQVTGALRIYTAAMGESHPHFHAHMVPRYTTMPRDARWRVTASPASHSGASVTTRARPCAASRSRAIESTSAGRMASSGCAPR